MDWLLMGERNILCFPRGEDTKLGKCAGLVVECEGVQSEDMVAMVEI